MTQAEHIAQCHASAIDARDTASYLWDAAEGFRRVATGIKVMPQGERSMIFQEAKDGSPSLLAMLARQERAALELFYATREVRRTIAAIEGRANVRTS